MTILNKPINRQAYNQMLIARNRADNHLALPAPVYDDVTDFTWSLNVLRSMMRFFAISTSKRSRSFSGPSIPRNGVAIDQKRSDGDEAFDRSSHLETGRWQNLLRRELQ
jgi:hypothetical protein